MCRSRVGTQREANQSHDALERVHPTRSSRTRFQIDQLHCDDTTWGTAADVAEIVSVQSIYLFPYHVCVDLFGSGRVKSRGCTSNFFETVEGLKVVAAKDVVPGSSVARDWYISSHLLSDGAAVPNHCRAVELFATRCSRLVHLESSVV